MNKYIFYLGNYFMKKNSLIHFSNIFFLIKFVINKSSCVYCTKIALQNLRTRAKMNMLKITLLNTQPPGSGNSGGGGPFWLSPMSSCKISHFYNKKKKIK